MVSVKPPGPAITSASTPKPQASVATKPATDPPKPQAGGATQGNPPAKPTVNAEKPKTEPANGPAKLPSGVNNITALTTKAAANASGSTNPFIGSIDYRNGPAGSTPSASTPSASTPSASTSSAFVSSASTPSASTPTASTPIGSTVIGSVPAGPAPAGTVKIFGGSQSNENNLQFTNSKGTDLYVIAERNLEKGEADPGGTVFKIPAGSSITVSAMDSMGLRFQVYNGQLTPEQQAQLAKGGTVDGVPRPAQTDVLYETHYNPATHLSHDDISPLDGAKTPMRVSGNGGRTVAFTQEIINGAPVHNPDGSIPGLGPSTSPFNNQAAIPALRDYYARTSLRPDGTRDFYYNSSDSGSADNANVTYTGVLGEIRTVIELG
ncbi:MAG: hypothetical protein K0Q50_767 [Vampirovibrio sp.]|nr:hypothetical protein [Vampirovibrio sp.]